MLAKEERNVSGDKHRREETKMKNTEYWYFYMNKNGYLILGEEESYNKYGSYYPSEILTRTQLKLNYCKLFYKSEEF